MLTPAARRVAEGKLLPAGVSMLRSRANPIMAGLYLAITLNLTLSTTLALLVHRLARRRPLAITLATTAILLLTIHLWKWRDSLWPAHILPFANMIFLADLTPPLVGLLAGIAARTLPGHPARRAALVVPLVLLSLYATYSTLWPRPTDLQNRWTQGVCRQTTPATCTPAAAATLLAANGIHTTEQEMAHLCLTTPAGTRTRGLYRGLKLKTANTNFTVQPFTGTIPDLKRALAHGPVILTVGLTPGANVDPRFEKEWGWARGVAHHIVAFRNLENDLVEMGDPAVGREPWDDRALRALWHGQGIQLLPR